jgi:hypothetical protein
VLVVDRAKPFRHQDVEVSAENLFLAVTEHVLSRLVEQGDLHVLIHADHAISGVLQYPGKASLTCSQSRLRALLFFRDSRQFLIGLLQTTRLGGRSLRQMNSQRQQSTE